MTQPARPPYIGQEVRFIHPETGAFRFGTVQGLVNGSVRIEYGIRQIIIVDLAAIHKTNGGK